MEEYYSDEEYPIEYKRAPTPRLIPERDFTPPQTYVQSGPSYESYSRPFLDNDDFQELIARLNDSINAPELTRADKHARIDDAIDEISRLYYKYSLLTTQKSELEQFRAKYTLIALLLPSS